MQTTAYEMRISDWSSDVCSSDLELNPGGQGVRLDKLAKITGELERFARQLASDSGISVKPEEWIARDFYNSSVGATIEYIGESEPELGSASGRERVCLSVLLSVVAIASKKNTK